MNPHDLYVITELKGDAPTPIHNEPWTFRQMTNFIETLRSDQDVVVWTLAEWFSENIAPYSENQKVRMFI